MLLRTGFTGLQAQGARSIAPPRPAIQRPESPTPDVDSIPQSQLRYSNFSGKSTGTGGSTNDASTTNGGSGRGSSATGPSMPQAASRLSADSRVNGSLGGPLGREQLEHLADETLGSDSPIWLSASERNQPASTSLPSDEVDKLVTQVLDVVYGRYKSLVLEGQLEAALDLLEACIRASRADIVNRLHHRHFMEAAKELKQSKHVLAYLRLLPRSHHEARLYHMAMDSFAAARDLDNAIAAIDLAKRNKIAVDERLLTQLMKVCKSVGNVDRAFRIFMEIKLMPGAKLDSFVYGVLIATCAEAMKRDLEVAHERKEQYVLLERAFQYVAEAEAAGIPLGTPVYNSLLTCAGRCGELNRAFQVLEMMQFRGVPPSVRTYGSLIEACVEARQPDKARRVFEVALSKGFSSLPLYTVAISACMIPGAVDLQHAMQLYQQIALKHFKPDKKLYACLMSVSGKAGQLDFAFQLLSDMHAEGLRPSSTTCSALVHACLLYGNLPMARKVYDLCRARKVFPVVSQFNRMMDWYAKDFKFGEVVSLLNDMTSAGVQPNLNTYRILINACQRAGQAGLAFQVFALMHGKKIRILQEKYAHTIYYTLVKSCFNQIRGLWALSEGSVHGRHSSAPLPQLRKQEAERLLTSLGGSQLMSRHRSNPFEGPPDTIDWASHAVSAFHHMLSRGHTPTLTMLDMVLNCLRLRRHANPDHPEDNLSASGMLAGTSTSTLFGSGSYDESDLPGVSGVNVGPVVESPFDKRAFQILEEVMTRGILPRFDPQSALQIDMRTLPPVVAEVYTLSAIMTLERRALKLGHTHYHHSFVLQVPPFDPDQIIWPSYLEKLNRHFTVALDTEDREELGLDARVSRQPQHRTTQQQQAHDLSTSQHAQQHEGGEQHAQAKAGSALESADFYEEGDEGMREIADDSESSDSDSDEMPHSPSNHMEFTADTTTGLAVAASFRRLKIFMTEMDWQQGMIVVSAQDISRWLKRRRQDAAYSAKAAASGAMVPGPAAGTATTASPGMPPVPGLRSPGASGAGSYGSGAPLGGISGGPSLGLTGKALMEQQRSIRSSSFSAEPTPGAPASPGGFSRSPLFGGSHGSPSGPAPTTNGHGPSSSGHASSSGAAPNGSSASAPRETPSGPVPAANRLLNPRPKPQPPTSEPQVSVKLGPNMGPMTIPQTPSHAANSHSDSDTGSSSSS